MVKLSRFGGKRTSKSHIHRFNNKWDCLGLITTYILSQISHKQSHFESLRQYYFGKPYICLGVQSHPEDQGDFGQGLTVNIWECNNQLELSVYNMCCSYMVLTYPHVKPWIQFIIMKIFMKLVQICPKSPRFTVLFFFSINVVTL